MLSQVLVGTLADGGDPQSLRDAVIETGQMPDDVVLLAGDDGLDELLGHDRDRGIFGRLAHLIRHIETLGSEGTGHAHVHYIGRWTVAQHGTVPPVAA